MLKSVLGSIYGCLKEACMNSFVTMKANFGICFVKSATFETKELLRYVEYRGRIPSSHFGLTSQGMLPTELCSSAGQEFVAVKQNY